MARSKRIIFSFDETSERELIDVTKTGNFKSKACAARDAITLLRELQNHFKDGFTELVMRNPKDGSERKIYSMALNCMEE